ncbi:hypothetical protein [Aequorivita sediminis]|uniref:hypothetical protein n=1 Tax=Aequorivita sediminis TaxID=3073653 RepID=UPI0028A96683|nr:hypothetical protein [Aequorivita sp. F6058]
MSKVLTSGPFVSKLSFRFLKDKYLELLKSDNPFEQLQAGQILNHFKENPILTEGIASYDEFKQHQEEIDILMSYLFPSVLSNNEIKAAIDPLSNFSFYKSNRLIKILEGSDGRNHNVLKEVFRDHIQGYDFIPYAIILNSYYQYNIDFDRPKNLKIRTANGEVKNYRVTFNADFVEIYPNEGAVEITQEVVDELLANAEDKNVWRKYFPEGSWTMEGFGIINLIDTTLDNAIDGFKTNMIRPNNESYKFLVEDIRKIFGIPDLQLGSYILDKNQLRPPYDLNFKMLTIGANDSIKCEEYACQNVYNRLFKEHKTVIISNVQRYYELTGGNSLSKSLISQGLKSAVLMPIVIQGQMMFILELATYKANQLNAINMVKIETLMPFILSYSARTITEFKNEISAVIQQECTSIHPSVQWRFEEEANQYIQNRNRGENAVFKEIVFENVIPLYGQIDIVGSSNARNEAVQIDYKEQLSQTKRILIKRIQDNKLPFYEQLIYQIDNFLSELESNFHTSTEQEINNFYTSQIFPLFDHILTSNEEIEDITSFYGFLDENLKSFYKARKNYDNTIDKINKELSCFIDKQQRKAQNMFPHYFEKFKTDGIEHNIYIGESIAQERPFHLTDLYNLRVWQLQVACEMEAMFYNAQKDFPLKLKVASLILAHDVPLNIRYRMDEKQFDVDGAYNVRYEIIKKRIDKAHIKNTNERLTQPHKLCVVYSSSAIEKEYLKYFEFLKAKNYITDSIEIVEIEELQGASGIKAIRAELNHNLEKAENLFTTNDLERIS